MKDIILFENFNSLTDDEIFTTYRKKIEGHGEIKDEYSYSNINDVDEMFGIIDSIIHGNFVIQKMNGYSDKVDDSLDKRILEDINFIKSIDGLSFEKGELKINGISKEDVIKGYIEHRNNFNN